MNKTVGSIVVVCGGIAVIAAILWYAFVPVEQKGRKPKDPARVEKTVRPMKTSVRQARPVRTNAVSKAVRPTVKKSAPAQDRWVESLPERDRKLGQGIVDNLDSENLAELKKLVGESSRCPNPEVRERMAEALGWFGQDALVELTEFLSDKDPEVARSAFNVWDSAVDQLDDESVRINVTVSAMKTQTDRDILTSLSSKFETAENRKAAIKGILAVWNGGNEDAQEVLKDAYRTVTGEEWKGVAAAMLKAQTIDKE